jgi:hypothetical protein
MHTAYMASRHKNLISEMLPNLNKLVNIAPLERAQLDL